MVRKNVDSAEALPEFHGKKALRRKAGSAERGSYYLHSVFRIHFRDLFPIRFTIHIDIGGVLREEPFHIAGWIVNIQDAGRFRA